MAPGIGRVSALVENSCSRGKESFVHINILNLEIEQLFKNYIDNNDYLWSCIEYE